MNLTQCAAHDGEILGINVNGAAFQRTKAGDDTVGVDAVANTKIFAAVSGIHLNFIERTGIEQFCNALTGGQFAFGFMLGNPIFSACLLRFSAAFAQF